MSTNIARRFCQLTILVAVVLPLVSLSAFAQQPRKVRVFFTPLEQPADAFVDAESKRMTDSHQDVLNEIKRHKEWEIVDTADRADLTITLAGSGMKKTGTTSTSRDHIGIISLPSATTEEVEVKTVTLLITVGEYERAFNKAGIGWRHAAGMTVLEIRQWTRENKAKLTATP